MKNCGTKIGAAIVAALFVTSPASASHDTPVKAKKFLIQFVRAFTPCTAPDTTHNPPLAFAACSAVSTQSATIGFGPKGSGELKGVTKLQAGQATDLALKAKFVDVRNGADGSGAPFDGELQLAVSVRLTDHNCVAAGSCTVIDFPFPFGLPCGSFANPPLPAGKCAVVTTANAVVAPNTIVPGARMSVSFGQWLVLDSPSGNPAFEGGVFLP